MLTALRKLQVTGIVCSLSVLALAGQRDSQSLESALTRDVLGWLPKDTETVTVARSFAIPDEPVRDADDRVGISFADTLRYAMFEGLGQVVNTGPIKGRKVRLAVQGERNFDVVSKFGTLRREACSVVVFDEALGSAWKDIEESLRSKADKILTFSGREVFQLPSTTKVASVFKSKEWEGLFVTQLKDDTLLIASSGKYIEEILSRMGENTAERAVPDVLTEWQYVDPEAPIWMIRHIPEKLPRTFFTGVTLNWRPEVLTTIYVGARGQAENVICAQWMVPTEIARGLEIEVAAPTIRVKNETVRVSLSTEKLSEVTPESWWYGLMIHRIHGEDGTMYGGREYIPEDFKPPAANREP